MYILHFKEHDIIAPKVGLNPREADFLMASFEGFQGFVQPPFKFPPGNGGCREFRTPPAPEEPWGGGDSKKRPFESMMFGRFQNGGISMGSFPGDYIRFYLYHTNWLAGVFLYFKSSTPLK